MDELLLGYAAVVHALATAEPQSTSSHLPTMAQLKAKSLAPQPSKAGPPLFSEIGLHFTHHHGFWVVGRRLPHHDLLVSYQDTVPLNLNEAAAFLV